MLKLNKNRLARLAALEQFLRKAEQTYIDDVIAFCQLHGKDIKERMVREDLKLLREGALNGVPLNIVVENKQYRIKAAGDKWSYESMAATERDTVPLVLSILEPYKELPSVKTVLEDLKSTHRLANKDVKLQSAMVSVKTVPENPAFVHLISKLMGYISRQVACEFNYFRVNEESSADLVPNFVEVYPVQIRIYENRYYLVGVKTTAEWVPQSLQIFTLDKIYRYKVDESVDQDSFQTKTFDWETLSRAIDLEHYFEHCVGIYRNYLVDKNPSVIYRWFKGWAASSVEAVPLHKSQKVVQRDGVNIRIRLEVYDTPELKGVFDRFGEYCWE
jgi:hypothetical protein